MSLIAPVRSRGARIATAASAAVAVAGFSLAGASAAFALPGDSGDIDIRSVGFHSHGDREGTEVCKFVLVADNFESFPAVPWTITAQPPTVPPGDTLLGTLPLVNGKARSQQYLLPEGTYQIVWTVPVGPKQKSFTVRCPEAGSNAGRQSADGRDNGGRQSAGSRDNGSAGEQESSWSGTEKEYAKPSGAVPAGGGGVPDMASVSSEGGSNVATAAALAAGAAGVAGLVLVRRSARNRARGEA
jgi:hypothetical protein